MPPRHSVDQGLHRYSDGSWGVDCYIGARRHREKVGLKSAARRRLAELRAEFDSGVAPGSKRERKTIAQWIDGFYLARPRSAADTIYIDKWKKSIGSLYPEQWTFEALRSWAWAQWQAGVAISSIYRQMDPLRTVFSEIVRQEALESKANPMSRRRELGLPKPNNERDAYLRQADAPAARRELGERYWRYAEFAILTGMRLGNQAALTRADIDWDSRVVKLHRTKSGEKFFVQLSDRTLALLREQLDSHQSDWVFPRLDSKGVPTGPIERTWFRRRVWAPAFKRAGIKNLTWHDLRHTFATWLTQSGESLFVVQQLCDHQDHETTQRYAHHNDQQARDAVERLSSVMATALGESASVHKASITVKKSGQRWITLANSNSITVAFSEN